MQQLPKTAIQTVQHCSHESIAILSQLIAFNTVSRESNLEMIDWCQSYLTKLGVKSRISYSSDKRKANLFATIGDVGQPGLVLSGHSDTVPVDGQDWSTDPFKATLVDNLVFGRGSADMKGFIAVCLAMAPQLLNAQGRKPLHLAITYDEETTMLGVRELLADLKDAGIHPSGCIVGEPTDMRVIVGHKGRRHIRCCVRGKEAHSSLTPQGVNAIEFSAKIIEFIRQMAERHKEHEQKNYGFDVPFTTMQTGTIRGGLSANTVPSQCDFDFEFRNLPWTDVDLLEKEVRDYALTKVLPEMQRKSPGCEITFETQSTFPPFGYTQDAEGLSPELAELLSTIGRKHSPLGFVGFGTEASWFQNAGIPTLICGPGSIDQAHKPNEHISLQQIGECEKFIELISRT